MLNVCLLSWMITRAILNMCCGILMRDPSIILRMLSGVGSNDLITKSSLGLPTWLELASVRFLRLSLTMPALFDHIYTSRFFLTDHFSIWLIWIYTVILTTKDSLRKLKRKTCFLQRIILLLVLFWIQRVTNFLI